MTPEPDKAFYWTSTAHKLMPDNCIVKANLGRMYCAGIGTEADIARGLQLLTEAHGYAKGKILTLHNRIEARKGQQPDSADRDAYSMEGIEAAPFYACMLQATDCITEYAALLKAETEHVITGGDPDAITVMKVGRDDHQPTPPMQ